MTNQILERLLWAGIEGLKEGRIQKEEVPLHACAACAEVPLKCGLQYLDILMPGAKADP